MTVEPTTRTNTGYCGVHVQDRDGVCVEIAGQWHWLSWSVASELMNTLATVVNGERKSTNTSRAERLSYTAAEVDEILSLQQYTAKEVQIARAERDAALDTIRRIAIEWPSVCPPCGCPPGAACPACEITFLLVPYVEELE